MLFTLAIALAIVVMILGHHWNRLSSRRWKLLSQFPGVHPLPLIGNALQIGFDADSIPERLMDIWRACGKKNFRFSLGSQDWVMLCEPSDVGIILSNQTELAKAEERNAAVMPFFGNSVSTSEGAHWQFIRKLMSSSFHFKTLDQKLVVVNNLSGRLIDKLTDYKDGEIIDIYRYIAPLMYDLFCNLFAGIDDNLLNNLDDVYLAEIQKVTKMITTNYFSYWRQHKILFRWTSEYSNQMKTIKIIRSNSENIINRRREKLNKIKDDIRRNNQKDEVKVEELIAKKLSEESCLLDDLIMGKMPNGDFIPEFMINDEISLLSFTGHYTGKLTLSNTLYLLSKHPEVQRKVFEEQTSIFEEDIFRKPTSKDLSQMKYLEAVIKETMRFIPTVPKIGRQLVKDLPLKDGRVIPNGTTVIVYYEALFQNPELFSESEKFIPERFFETMPTYAFMPFSAGPRNCIAFRYAWVAMKAILSNLVRRFEISEGVEPRFVHRFLTESDNGVQLRLKRRIY